MDIRTQYSGQLNESAEKDLQVWKSQIELVQSSLGADLESTRLPGADPTDVPILFVKKESVVKALLLLRDHPELQYQFLSDITATDEGANPRFNVVYQLFSLNRKSRIRVKVRVAEGDEVPTAVEVWPGANWAEREVWDMFGIRFTGHPDMRRILMDERWQGHPLRKDYPLRGYQVFFEPSAVQEELLK